MVQMEVGRDTGKWEIVWVIYEQRGASESREKSQAQLSTPSIEVISILTARGGFKGRLQRAMARVTDGPVLRGDQRSGELR